MAEFGTTVERGGKVQVKKSPNVDHCIWLATHGAGFGKMQWT